MRKYISAIFFTTYTTITLWVVGKGGWAQEEYSQFYKQLGPTSQSYYPEKYEGLILILVAIVLVLLGAMMSALIEKSNRAINQTALLDSEFYARIATTVQVYFNDRLHELVKGTFDSELSTRGSHNTAIIGLLYALRETIMTGYKYANVRITLMIPEIDKYDKNRTKLFIRYWANDEKRTPTTLKKGKGFAVGEGFCGRAWQTALTQIGAAKKYLVIRDARYVKTSSDQDGVKSYLSIPIFDEGPSAGGRRILAVLNIDADKRLFFPLRRRKAREFAKALRPFLIMLNFHLTYVERLEAAA